MGSKWFWPLAVAVFVTLAGFVAARGLKSQAQIPTAQMRQPVRSAQQTQQSSVTPKTLSSRHSRESGNPDLDPRFTRTQSSRVRWPAKGRVPSSRGGDAKENGINAKTEPKTPTTNTDETLELFGLEKDDSCSPKKPEPCATPAQIAPVTPGLTGLGQ